MGIFKRLFGKDNSSGNDGTLQKTAQLMDEEQFWKLVADSLKNTDNQDGQEAWLISRLGQLSPAEIIGFRLRTNKLLYDTYSSDMWCAAYIINGGCSDDGFEYFRCWLISRGKKIYYAAKENPDSLVAETGEEEEDFEFESFWYVALEAFEHKTGKNLFDYVDGGPTYGEGDYPAIELTWEEDDPESMRAICPKLFAASDHF